jgi:hypothetical protein
MVVLRIRDVYLGSKSVEIFSPLFSVNDLDSMGYWIRIRIANADPDPEGGKSAQKKKKK